MSITCQKQVETVLNHTVLKDTYTEPYSQASSNLYDWFISHTLDLQVDPHKSLIVLLNCQAFFISIHDSERMDKRMDKRMDITTMRYNSTLHIILWIIIYIYKFLHTFIFIQLILYL